MDDELFLPAPDFRRALPRIGLDEASDLPPRRLAELLAAAGERAAAADAYREHLAQSPGDLDAMERLAGVLARLGRVEEELALRTRIAAITSDRLGLQPEDREAVIAFELAAIGAGDAPATAPPAYVAATFDLISAIFDDRLRRSLRYRGPEQVVERIAREHGSGDGSLVICDAGCGTGLVGPLLRPYARLLRGVDLSPGMLEKARARGVYDDLVAAELTSFFLASPEVYDVVTAADVFVYVGDVRPAFAAIAGALREGGIFVSTFERADEGDFVLLDVGRYAHGLDCVREAARLAGLEEISIEEEELRREKGTAVRALIATHRRPARGG
jgi:predicted TPR repeat methyltransferase